LAYLFGIIGIVGECLHIGHEDKHAVEIASILQLNAPKHKE